MAKKAAKAKSVATEAPATANAPTISKAEAVRKALAAGMDGPPEGTAYLQREFGIEMTSQMWSSYKSQEKARAAKHPEGMTGKPGRKPKAAIEGYLAPPPKSSASGDGDLLDAMEAMKPLVASLGKDQVKRIVDLLG
jgi:hypothetical protein